MLTALRGSLALLLIGTSTIVLSTVVCVGGLVRFLAPTQSSRARVRHWLASLAELWIGINNRILDLFQATHWDIGIPAELDYQGCYVVSCNHQSWVDILALQRSFNRRLPLLRFFLKKELFWVPFMGLAWWSLDFPFMQRYSKEQVRKKPSLAGKDLENARKACEKFREIPVAMMSFPEGTRFSEQKRIDSGSPYKRLLKPRIGGIGQVFYALGEQLDGLVDVTIVYPDSGHAEPPTFWQLVSGQIPRIKVRAQKRDVPPELLGREFRRDRNFRGDLQAWMDAQWLEKDAQIQQLELGGSAASSRT
ncbi:MAG TPA: acyltransferase [Xanthomonadales bacterium]|nr:acyltransferase [Xanthomonadales bacterium]